MNEAVQLVGGPPSGAGSAQMNQSRLSDPGSDTASTNHGWSEDTWLGTKSTISRMPRSCSAARSASKSSRVPKTGSTAQWSLTS